jgi:hypothetical protein
MPHAENGADGNKTMTQINGDHAQSQFITHLASYPLVSDSIEIYKSNPYGAKSISITSQLLQTYNQSVNPHIYPFLRTPFSFVAPYLAKADSLGDNGLTSLETRFPIVREPTSDIRTRIVDTASYPFSLANQSKEYVLNTFNEEYQKAGDKSDGLTQRLRAVISTELRLTAEVLSYVREVLQKKGNDVKVKLEEKHSAIDTYIREKKHGAD